MDSVALTYPSNTHKWGKKVKRKTQFTVNCVIPSTSATMATLRTKKEQVFTAQKMLQGYDIQQMSIHMHAPSTRAGFGCGFYR